jgi:hypothetical protein
MVIGVLLTMNTCTILLTFNNLDPDPIFLLRYEELSTFLTVISDLIMSSYLALKMGREMGLIVKIMFLLMFICLRIV